MLTPLFQIFRTVFAGLFVTMLMFSGLSHAHEIRPSIMDIGLEENSAIPLEIRLSFTAESFLAGMDLSDLADTDDSPEASEYDRLRALSTDQLSLLVEAAFPSLSQAVTIRLDDQPMAWELKHIHIEDITNQDIIRETTIVFLATQPDAPPDTLFDKEAVITVDWPPAMGGLLIRQHGEGSDVNYIEFLETGGESSGFTLGEIYQPSFWDIIKRYIHSGVIHIVPYGLDHILFVVGLLAFSRSGHHLLLQISLFTVAHTLTLAAASLGWVQISPSIVEPLIALSIAYIAIENLLRASSQPEPSLRLARGGVVFAFGLLHGLGFASV
ncbi:MAG: HupE/UreJ family protein, partial [Candidatus Puniceispirillales bacterium]